MPLEVGDVIRVAMTGSAPQASVWQNVWHYVMTTGSGMLESAAVAEIKSNIEDSFLEIDSFLSNTYSWDTIDVWVRDKTLQVWNGIGSETLDSLDGLSALDPLPHGSAIVGLIVTDLLRRQGRTFLPGLEESTTEDGLFTVATLVGFGLYLADFVQLLSPAGGQLTWCTYNTEVGSDYEETESEYAGTVIINDIVGYQRRRKPLVGI